MEPASSDLTEPDEGVSEEAEDVEIGPEAGLVGIDGVLDLASGLMATVAVDDC